jgi:hypothetical protein
MAATVVSNELVQSLPFPVAEVKLSGLTAALTETISFPVSGRPEKVPLKQVELVQVVTEPTSGDPVFLGVWASDESNNRFTVKLDTVNGGDLSGAVIKLRLSWLDQARQDGQSLSQDNDA